MKRFQSLRGKLSTEKLPGFSIDLLRIINYSYRRRFFILTDPGKPFLLTIEYYIPLKFANTGIPDVISSTPSINSCLSAITNPIKIQKQLIYLRYNEEDLYNDINLMHQNMKEIESSKEWKKFFKNQKYDDST